MFGFLFFYHKAMIGFLAGVLIQFRRVHSRFCLLPQ